ncbi:cation-transporting P-type ATPase [Rhodococcus sp. NPDC003348]
MTATTPDDVHTPTAQDLLASLGVDVDRGLSDTEVSRRRAEYGEDVLQEEAGESALRKIIRPLADKMALVLVVAAAISALVSNGEPVAVRHRGGIVDRRDRGDPQGRRASGVEVTGRGTRTC